MATCHSLSVLDSTEHQKPSENSLLDQENETFRPGLNPVGDLLEVELFHNTGWLLYSDGVHVEPSPRYVTMMVQYSYSFNSYFLFSSD